MRFKLALVTYASRQVSRVNGERVVHLRHFYARPVTPLFDLARLIPNLQRTEPGVQVHPIRFRREHFGAALNAREQPTGDIS